MAAHAQHLLKWKYFSFIAVYCVASDVTVMQYRGGPLSQSGASLHCARAEAGGRLAAINTCQVSPAEQ